MKVTLVAAMTICGRISPAGFGSSQDRQLLENLRAATDASLIGAGTVRQADPELRGPGGEHLPHRLRAVISNSGDFPVEQRRLFTGGPVPLVYTDDGIAVRLAKRLGNRAIVKILPRAGQGLCLVSLLHDLGTLGAESVLIEGGALLNYAALAAGVVDEIRLTVAPLLSGDRSAASLVGGAAPLGSPFLALDLVSCQQWDSGEINLHYTIRKGDRNG